MNLLHKKSHPKMAHFLFAVALGVSGTMFVKSIYLLFSPVNRSGPSLFKCSAFWIKLATDLLAINVNIGLIEGKSPFIHSQPYSSLTRNIILLPSAISGIFGWCYQSEVRDLVV
ncbi:hypothetical protein BKP32_24115 [Salmonella enterica subsp. enterica serovar Kentucky]|nr:hypothetical protein BKP32_24115 [Salmonella enterica subsp. enterica serovar Kentucky]